MDLDLLQLVGVNINHIVHNPVLVLLIQGASEGVIVGLVTGAIVWSITKAPDVLGRALLLAVIFGLLGFIWEFTAISLAMGFSMGEIIRALSDNPAIGPMFLRAFIRTALYMLLGALIGIGSRVPQYMIRGIIGGIFAGALVGALIWFVTRYFLGLTLNIALFRLFVVLGVWGTITAFVKA
ncbi:MAG: hypothetical protein P8183_01850 [Anaerolineae bacterium]|jgi:hypothetical protein